MPWPVGLRISAIPWSCLKQPYIHVWMPVFSKFFCMFNSNTNWHSPHLPVALLVPHLLAVINIYQSLHWLLRKQAINNPLINTVQLYRLSKVKCFFLASVALTCLIKKARNMYSYLSASVNFFLQLLLTECNLTLFLSKLIRTHYCDCANQYFCIPARPVYAHLVL